MDPVKRLYKKDKIITKSIHIDENLYEKLQYLCDYEYDTTVNKLINICIETLLQRKQEIKLYKKPYKTVTIYRSVLFRKEFYDQLLILKEETGIPFSRLVNGSIKQFTDKHYKRKKQVQK